MAELHCHIEGAAHPDLVEAHAARHGIDVSAIIHNGHYVWHDFTSFLAAYDLASSVFRTEADYADLAADHLGRLAAAGTIYAEFFISPDHAREAGLSPEAYVAGLSRGIAQARHDHDIEARMIVVGVRHLGAEAVERAARFAARPGQPLVTGFGLAGDERIGAPADFARAFAIARDAGLGLTAHAGELCGAESVRATLDALKPSRIGHGVRTAEDPDLVRRIVAEGIVLEVCPGSNLALGLYPDAAAHPLKQLVATGARVTLNSDDPPFFRTSLADEYAFAAQAGIDAGTRLGFTRQAVEAAFVDEATRRRLQDRLGLVAIALGAPSAGG
ncbi:adenosine deaminase [Aurantimonas sp. HBX-1]|uniref:adenosine deaminase n=1 Tax=Aurantimonas sp. HBX-1 TaxID=2906072 RepID=UPI001F39BE02|nr:adenosine deaminase [Aurantimonas sp. HBX-1]UIJ74212.1 adenosine deaminase [Aurantimonas sp. HBX-1]